MQNAFNKYGTDSFVCEILEVITDESKLLEREAYYIEKYDSFYNGYNENPIPSRSPMLNKNSREKSSKTHKEFWENLEKKYV
jgi:group I intron endonuclease